MEQLIALSNKKLASTDTGFKRYLYEKINWNNQLIVIKGAKGVGKTTLLLQHIKESFRDYSKTLYVSMDHIWFSNHSLLELAERFCAYGGTHLFLDEVHKYENWETEVKNIFDFYPELHVVITGSSLLRLEGSLKGDLSRRARQYDMAGMSFREFLEFEKNISFPIQTLDEIVTRHSYMAAELATSTKVLPLFNEYLQHGYYPFYKNSEDGFLERLQSVVDSVIEVDVPAVSNIEYATVRKMKRLVSLLSASSPYTPNITTLCKQLETSRNNALKMLDLVDKADIIRQLYTSAGFGSMTRPSKVLFNNSNLAYAFSGTNIGTVRESFFASQLAVDHELIMPDAGDIMVDSRYLFEIGGRKKGFTQIKDIPGSYIAADDIEIGGGNKIPLWVFGLLY